MPTLLLTLCCVLSADVGKHDEVLFYPGYASQTADGKHWTGRVQGSVYEPETDSIKRKLLIAAVRKTLDVKEDSREAAILGQRMRTFLVDHQSKVEISVRVGDAVYKLSVSDGDGHIEGEVRIPAAAADRLAQADPNGGRWLAFTAVLPKGDKRQFSGRVQLVPDRGLTIVSDIDDTVKVTQVRDRQEMLANTFLREFQAVPGMADLYRKAAQQNASIHFVSGGPWQLFSPIDEFLRKEKFPPASFAMKKVRLSSPTAVTTLSTSDATKREAIGRLLKAFPQRRFVLVGDSGEQDPETYGRIARENPQAIEAIWIRNVTDEKPENPRFRAAMAGVDAQRLRLFRQASELTLPELP